MATGKEFMSQLETRFAQLSVEERLDKIVEYQKKLTALKAEGLSEEAAAELEAAGEAAEEAAEAAVEAAIEGASPYDTVIGSFGKVTGLRTRGGKIMDIEWDETGVRTTEY